MASAAELIAVVKARDEASGVLKGFSSTVKGLNTDLRGLLGGFAGLGLGVPLSLGAVVAAGVNLTTTFASAGEEIRRFSLMTGFSTEAVAKWKYALNLTGDSLTALQAASRILNLRLEEASVKGGDAEAAFAKLGMTWQGIMAMAPEAQFEAVARAIGGLGTHQERVNAAFEVFGLSATSLLPILDNIKTKLDEADKSALKWSDDMVKSAQLQQENWQRFTDGVEQAKVSVVSAIPAIMEAMQDLWEAEFNLPTFGANRAAREAMDKRLADADKAARDKEKADAQAAIVKLRESERDRVQALLEQKAAAGELARVTVFAMGLEEERLRHEKGLAEVEAQITGEKQRQLALQAQINAIIGVAQSQERAAGELAARPARLAVIAARQAAQLEAGHAEETIQESEARIAKFQAGQPQPATVIVNIDGDGLLRGIGRAVSSAAMKAVD